MRQNFIFFVLFGNVFLVKVFLFKKEKQRFLMALKDFVCLNVEIYQKI